MRKKGLPDNERNLTRAEIKLSGLDKGVFITNLKSMTPAELPFFFLMGKFGRRANV